MNRMSFLIAAIAPLFISASLEAAPKKAPPPGETPKVKVAYDGKERGTGLRKLPQAYEGFGQTAITLDGCEDLPAEFDLRDLGVVPPVKDQGAIGSCWAFSKTAAVESMIATQTGKLINLSEQQLVSCDSNNWGGRGGLLNAKEFQYTKGQAAEADFPYVAKDVRCKSGLEPVAKLPQPSFVVIKKTSDKDEYDRQVRCAQFKTKTIPWITVAANGRAWSNPPTATNAVWPSSGRGGTNHAGGTVGWSTLGGKVYHKWRNSWSASWGSNAGREGSERGYALIPIGADSFGDEVAFPTASLTPCAPPTPRLPIEMIVTGGESFMLAVKAEAGVKYAWTKDGAYIGDGPVLEAVVQTEAVFKVAAKNACGAGETQVRVKAAVAAPVGP